MNCVQTLDGKLKGDQDVEWSIILIRILEKQGITIWIGFFWLTIQTTGNMAKGLRLSQMERNLTS
jgi:hypothetical protein